MARPSHDLTQKILDDSDSSKITGAHPCGDIKHIKWFLFKGDPVIV